MNSLHTPATTSSPGRIYTLLVFGLAVFLVCFTIDALRSSSPLLVPPSSEAASTSLDEPADQTKTHTLAVSQESPAETPQIARQHLAKLLAIAGSAAFCAFFVPGSKTRIKTLTRREIDVEEIAGASGLPILGQLFSTPARHSPPSSKTTSSSWNVRRWVALASELTLCAGFLIAIGASATNARIARQFTSQPLIAYIDSVRWVADQAMQAGSSVATPAQK